jgi:hypothetical protein
VAPRPTPCQHHLQRDPHPPAGRRQPQRPAAPRPGLGGRPDKLTLRGGLDHKKYNFSTYEFRRVNQNDTIFAPAAGTALASLTTMLTGFGKGLNLPEPAR